MNNNSIFFFIVFCLLSVAVNVVALEKVCIAQDFESRVMDLNVGLSAKHIEAKTVLIEFLNALYEGNTSMLKQLLDGNLLEKRKRLLDNPLYPEFLRKMYSEARFEIHGYENIGSNRIKIDAKIFLNDEESIPISFFLVTKAHKEGFGSRTFCICDGIERVDIDPIKKY
jgi:hypothetical protein